MVEKKVELPDNLSFAEIQELPKVQRQGGASDNPFLPKVKESLDTGKMFAVTVPRDAEDRARTRIRHAASLLDCGVVTRVVHGKDKTGKELSKVSFKAGAKSKRGPKGPRTKKESASK